MNVFGGITACDAVANGIIQALAQLGEAVTRPIVVRLDGNNAAAGRALLARAPLIRWSSRWTRWTARAARAAGCWGCDHGDLADREIPRRRSGHDRRGGLQYHRRMLAAGTDVVGGVNPRKAGTSFEVKGTSLPVFASVGEAMKETGADMSVIFVPPAHTSGSAIIEAVDAEIPLAVVITEGVPVLDTAAAWARARGGTATTRIMGPNCPGLISPGRANAGIIPADITGPGRIGLVSKSGTLTYQLMHELRDIGFSTCVGIGGDPIIGTTHIDCLAAFENDPDTDAIILVGEIGGDAEERAAAFIASSVTKPVVGYIAGFTAPPGKTMGHAGAIISGSSGTATARKRRLWRKRECPGGTDPYRDRGPDA